MGPFAWFAIRRAIPQGYGWRLFALFALGGLQGAIGWWMVAMIAWDLAAKFQVGAKQTRRTRTRAKIKWPLTHVTWLGGRDRQSRGR